MVQSISSRLVNLLLLLGLYVVGAGFVVALVLLWLVLLLLHDIALASWYNSSIPGLSVCCCCWSCMLLVLGLWLLNLVLLLFGLDVVGAGVVVAQFGAVVASVEATA